jgi:predicted DNA-binding antitoxin AbrB/MazE fold protein
MANKTVLTKKFRLMLAVTAVTVAIGISGCTIPVGTGEHHDENGVTTSRGEHEREGGNGDGEDSEHASASDGEESGNTLTLTERYDTVRKGTRLVLAYDAQNNAFNGTVENITSSTLQHVRVEVHLSNGVELGPTTPVDLAPGQKVDVTLPATAQAFDGWTPHAEVGPGTGGEAGEHGSGGEDGEHGSASDGEESGNTLTLTEQYDTVRKGARLVLVYDAESNAFNGTVENTTDSTLQQVRVEVHLSNGVELGPTTPVDLAPGQKVDVTLPATAQAFDGWTTPR